ncbi:hypothetical protein HK102_006897 [Quaeritorhiza haematococci]|nr:hypothetical protein HK102_006897 [Quaeritorhiza haematococci]
MDMDQPPQTAPYLSSEEEQIRQVVFDEMRADPGENFVSALKLQEEERQRLEAERHLEDVKVEGQEHGPTSLAQIHGLNNNLLRKMAQKEADRLAEEERQRRILLAKQSEIEGNLIRKKARETAIKKARKPETLGILIIFFSIIPKLEEEEQQRRILEMAKASTSSELSRKLSAKSAIEMEEQERRRREVSHSNENVSEAIKNARRLVQQALLERNYTTHASKEPLPNSLIPRTVTNREQGSLSVGRTDVRTGEKVEVGL